MKRRSFIRGVLTSLCVPIILRSEPQQAAVIALSANTESFVRCIATARAQCYEIAAKERWLSANEIRALEDMPPIPEAAL